MYNHKTKSNNTGLTARPTVPSPKTATVDPGSTFAVFQTAPRPKSQAKYYDDWDLKKET